MFTLLTIGCIKRNNESQKLREKDEKTFANVTKTSSLKFIDKRVVQFSPDSMVPDDTIKRQIRFINNGSNPLVLKDYWSSCNCTNIAFSKTYIQPGDSAYVEIALDTKGKHGYVRVYAVLTFNTEPEKYKLILQGNIL